MTTSSLTRRAVSAVLALAGVVALTLADGGPAMASKQGPTVTIGYPPPTSALSGRLEPRNYP